MTISMETVILKSLSSNPEYTRSVIPFLKKDYFKNKAEQVLYSIEDAYFRKYNACASLDVLRIEADKLKGVNETVFRQALSIIEALEVATVDSTQEWLMDNTEAYVKERALNIALAKSIEIYDGSEKNLTSTAIPGLLSDALAVGFETKQGHDYDEDADKQIEYYHSDVIRIPFDVDVLNKITNGGIPRKTLTIFVAGTHVGKSLTMCSLAGGMYLQGANVLYITMEESEEEIRKRIDANLMNITMDDLLKVDRNVYKKKMAHIRSKATGKLKIKGFATKSAGASHFRYLLQDYKLKQNFVPDIIFVDYLNICLADNFKDTGNSSSYMKAVAEELRGVTFEGNCALVTAAQLNRTGFKDSDPGMDDVADSFSSLFVGDAVFVITSPDELRAKNMVQIKQEKNRFKNMNWKRRFMLGTDPYKMRVYDVEEKAQPVQQVDSRSKVSKSTFDLIDEETGEVIDEGISASKAGRFKEFVYD